MNDSANAGTSYTRSRTSLTGQWFPRESMELALRFTNEFRTYFAPENRPFNGDEIFVDQLYFKWKGNLKRPTAFTLGRQNIMLGEGFVVMDGGPLDGSRSGYFNAARLDYEILPKKSLTLIYSFQHEKDDILPLINDREKAMNEQPERTAILHFSGDFSGRLAQSYFIRKDADSSAVRPFDSKVNAIGARLQSPVVKNLSLTVEGAYETGLAGSADLSAFGGYGYLTYQTGWPKRYPLSLTSGTIYLSGDDTSTPEFEGWDPLYGRWPKWSDSFIYTFPKESGVAYWTNFISLFGRAQVDLTKSVKFTVDYHHLMAPENCAVGCVFPGGEGKNRGELFIGRVNYQINKTVAGHVIWENFNPGSYYFSDASHADWLRIEFFITL